LGLCAGIYAVASPIPTLLNHYWPPLMRSSLIILALLIGSGGIAYSMVRHRFLDANLIARKSILYAVTSVFLFGVYVLIVRRFDILLESLTTADTTVFQTAFLLLSLLLFQPVFSWLEELLDRQFLRDRGDVRTLLRRVSGEMLTVLDLVAIAACPRDGYVRLVEGAELLRMEEIAPLAQERGVADTMAAFLAIGP